MVHSVKCLLWKEEDESFHPHHSHKDLDIALHTCNSSTWEVDIEGD